MLIIDQLLSENVMKVSYLTLIIFQVTFEMQANDLIADLRAEVSAWWEGKMADHRSSIIAAAAAALVMFDFFCFEMVQINFILAKC